MSSFILMKAACLDIIVTNRSCCFPGHKSSTAAFLLNLSTKNSFAYSKLAKKQLLLQTFGFSCLLKSSNVCRICGINNKKKLWECIYLFPYFLLCYLRFNRPKVSLRRAPGFPPFEKWSICCITLHRSASQAGIESLAVSQDAERGRRRGK